MTEWLSASTKLTRFFFSISRSQQYCVTYSPDWWVDGRQTTGTKSFEHLPQGPMMIWIYNPSLPFPPPPLSHLNEPIEKDENYYGAQFLEGVNSVKNDNKKKEKKTRTWIYFISYTYFFYFWLRWRAKTFFLLVSFCFLHQRFFFLYFYSSRVFLECQWFLYVFTFTKCLYIRMWFLFCFV